MSAGAIFRSGSGSDMEGLADVAPFLLVLLHGATFAALALTIGGLAFRTFLTRPLVPALDGPAGSAIRAMTRRGIAFSACLLALAAAGEGAFQAAMLAAEMDLPPAELLGAGFVQADGVMVLAALVLAVLTWRRVEGTWAAVAAAAVLLPATAATSHAAAQMDGRTVLMAATMLHLLGASIWIGGIPYLIGALRHCRDGVARRLIGRRFSLMAMAAVGLLTGCGLILLWVYAGSTAALTGTGYGVTLLAKLVLFGGLLFLGFMNFRVVERLRASPSAPIHRLCRFAEAEVGIGLAVFLAAASLTAQTPALDVPPPERVALADIAARLTPSWPRLASPAADSLTGHGRPQDIAWSEFNHNWSGLFMLAIGLLGMASHWKILPAARHWPLLFVGLAVFIAIRSDPEVWPLGHVGLIESLDDPEILQHRLALLAVLLFGLFEWGIRTGRLSAPSAALVFPVACMTAGGLLLVHSHQTGAVRQDVLIAYSHLPIGLLGIAAGWSRWLELRLPPPDNRIPAAVWPLCFLLTGLLLLIYREG